MKKKLKLKYLKELLTIFQTTTPWFGLCAEFNALLTRDGLDRVEDFKITIPELEALRPFPRWSSMYWFPLTPEGHEERIRLLKQAIKLLS